MGSNDSCSTGAQTPFKGTPAFKVWCRGDLLKARVNPGENKWNFSTWRERFMVEGLSQVHSPCPATPTFAPCREDTCSSLTSAHSASLKVYFISLFVGSPCLQTVAQTRGLLLLYTCD